MPIERKDNSDRSTTLRITITKDQYLEEWQSELRKTRQKAQFKGFRKGKTPLGFVKKMYGQSILSDTVNKNIQSELSTYIQENELPILGQPIPSEEQMPIDFNLNDLRDYSFNFDIGLAPEFDLLPFSEMTFDKDKVTIAKDAIDEELLNAQKRFGELVEVDHIEKDDLITVEAKELNEEGEIKEDGHQNSFQLAINLLIDDLQTNLLGKEVNHRFNQNIFNLEKETSEDKVKKHFLGLNDDDQLENESFQFTVTEIKRQELAEMNEEFYSKMFSAAEIKDEEQARSKITEELEKYYDLQAERLMLHQVREDLIEKHDLTLPDDFLKRWLKISNENKAERDVDHEYFHVAEDLRWSLIQSKISESEGIEVKPEDIKAAFEKQVLGYFGGSIPQENLDEMVDRYLKNREQVEKQYETLRTEKVFDALLSKIQINPKDISLEDFKEKVIDFNKGRHEH